MKIALIASPTAEHQTSTANALRLGMEKYGDTVEMFHNRMHFCAASTRPDVVCVWSWRRGLEYFRDGFNVLVMERAYVADRFKWVSLGWNGLNGRATWPKIDDGGERWCMHFNDLIKPWASSGEYALVLGQVPSDMACKDIIFTSWAANVIGTLRNLGHKVKFRPHPQAPCILASSLVDHTYGPLSDNLSGARFAVTFNSNSGVDAVLAGIPLYALDRGSMAWEVAANDLFASRVMPDRSEWTAKLAWRQWLPEELADGSAWTTVRAAMPLRRHS